MNEGYSVKELDEMVYAIQSVLTTVNSDDDPWLHGNLWKAQEFLQGLRVSCEGSHE